MPREGESSRVVKKQLKELVKINIVKPKDRHHNYRPTAKLIWECYFNGYTKTYQCHKSLYQLKRESHSPAEHTC
jgi:hypothetical protein